MVQQKRNTSVLPSVAYLWRRNSTNLLYRVKPKHSIKCLHLVKTLTMLSLVLPNVLPLCILESLSILACRPTSVMESEFLFPHQLNTFRLISNH